MADEMRPVRLSPDQIEQIVRLIFLLGLREICLELEKEILTARHTPESARPYDDVWFLLTGLNGQVTTDGRFPLAELLEQAGNRRSDFIESRELLRWADHVRGLRSAWDMAPGVYGLPPRPLEPNESAEASAYEDLARLRAAFETGRPRCVTMESKRGGKTTAALRLIWHWVDQPTTCPFAQVVWVDCERLEARGYPVGNWVRNEAGRDGALEAVIEALGRASGLPLISSWPTEIGLGELRGRVSRHRSLVIIDHAPVEEDGDQKRLHHSIQRLVASLPVSYLVVPRRAEIGEIDFYTRCEIEGCDAPPLDAPPDSMAKVIEIVRAHRIPPTGQAIRELWAEASSDEGGTLSDVTLQEGQKAGYLEEREPFPPKKTRAGEKVWAVHPKFVREAISEVNTAGAKVGGSVEAWRAKVCAVRAQTLLDRLAPHCQGGIANLAGFWWCGLRLDPGRFEGDLGDEIVHVARYVSGELLAKIWVLSVHYLWETGHAGARIWMGRRVEKWIGSEGSEGSEELQIDKLDMRVSLKHLLAYTLLDGLGWPYLVRGALDEASEVIAAGEECSNGCHELVAFARLRRAQILRLQGRLREADVVLRSVKDAHPNILAAIARTQGDIERKLGRTQHAARHYYRAEALERAGSTQRRRYLVRSAVSLAHMALDRNDLARAEEHLSAHRQLIYPAPLTSGGLPNEPRPDTREPEDVSLDLLTRARLTWAMGRLALGKNDRKAAVRLLVESRDLLRYVGDLDRLGHVRRDLAKARREW